MTKDTTATSSLCETTGREHSYTLNIAIPTFNRAARLSRSLDEIREIILCCHLENSVSVYVTDNGSTDNTREVLAEQSSNFKKSGINFSTESVEMNQGFDNNIYRCFSRGTGDYCWFVSDDDNLEKDILLNIFHDINENTPSLIIYNFDQAPYSKKSPLIKERQFTIAGKTDFGFAQLLNMPKLTSLVIRRVGDPLQSEVFNYEHVLNAGFSHIALAMHTAYHYGRVLLTNDFCARPDPDFRDHIDFPPYIGNRYNEMARVLFQHMGKPEWMGLYSGAHTDVGVSALEWLTDHYKGRAVVPSELRRELRKGIKEYLVERNIRLFLHPKFFRRCVYLAVAWVRYLILENIFHVRVIRQRKVNK